jgi:hypothetical protein
VLFSAVATAQLFEWVAIPLAIRLLALIATRVQSPDRTPTLTCADATKMASVGRVVSHF